MATYRRKRGRLYLLVFLSALTGAVDPLMGSDSTWNDLKQRSTDVAADKWSRLERELLLVLSPDQLESWMAGASPHDLILDSGESLDDFLESRRATSFSLSRFSIDGGGGVSEYGDLRLTGSLGQPDASMTVMAAGGFELTGGFLAVPAGVRDRVGIHRGNYFLLDVDGSGTVDIPPDRGCLFGLSTDIAIHGDWDGDGRDQIGVYRASSKSFLMDLDGSCSWTPATDRACQFGDAGDQPIVGDWDGDGDDDIGIYRPSDRLFLRDVDASCSVTTADYAAASLLGLIGDQPIIGDWNGDGDDDIGIYRPSNRLYLMDLDEGGTWTPATDLGCLYGVLGDQPLIGDWNADGDDDIGSYRPPSRLFLMDRVEDCRFRLGEDLAAIFGALGDEPIIGKW